MPRSRKPAWTRPLSEPLRTRDGTALTTLADARAYMLGLSEARSSRVSWQKAAELALAAAAGGDIAAASRQIELAMLMDGDMDFGPPRERWRPKR